MSTLPVPTDYQVRQVRQALARWTKAANAALVSVDIPAYRAAIAEVRVNQSWLDTYVDNRDEEPESVHLARAASEMGEKHKARTAWRG